MILLLDGRGRFIVKSPPSFDYSLWFEFIDSRIQLSLITGLTSLQCSLDVLGTQLIKRFASCYSNCGGVEWKDGTGINDTFLEMLPPCGVINVGILQGSYINHPICLSWHIQHVHTAVINLTVEELTFPISSIMCDNSYVRIDGISVRQRKLCGKQVKQIYYSKDDVSIELFARLLVHNSKLCLSYSYGWYYEPDISDKDIHMTDFNKEYTLYELLALVQNMLVYIQLSQVGTVMRKLLFGADFMNDIVTEIHVFTGLSSIQMHDGPGKMSPLIRRAPQYSNITSLVQFYLYIEVTALSYDEGGYIEYENVLDDLHVKGKVSSYTHYESHFVDLTSSKVTSAISIESKGYANTWYKIRILGDALTLWLNDFSFNGPSVRFLQSDFYTCQFGGLFLRLRATSSKLKFHYMSVCDNDISPRTALALGTKDVYIHVLYLVGYSEGSLH